ncbi:MAG: DUF4282 domain-containing protein [Gaiellaceae bacterium]
MKALDPFEVWLVTGSQEMYGDAVLRRVDEHSREVAASLDAADAVPVRIVRTPVMTSAESIHLLFWLGVVASVVVGITLIIHAFGLTTRRDRQIEAIYGLLVIFIGPLVVRIYCEILILFFRMNDSVSDIRNHLLARDWGDEEAGDEPSPAA